MIAALRAHFDAQQARAQAFMQQLEEEAHNKTKTKRKKHAANTSADVPKSAENSAESSAEKCAHMQSTDVPAGVWQEAAAGTADIGGRGSEDLGGVAGAVGGESGKGSENTITPCLVDILKSQLSSLFWRVN